MLLNGLKIDCFHLFVDSYLYYLSFAFSPHCLIFKFPNGFLIYYYIMLANQGSRREKSSFEKEKRNFKNTKLNIYFCLGFSSSSSSSSFSFSLPSRFKPSASSSSSSCCLSKATISRCFLDFSWFFMLWREGEERGRKNIKSVMHTDNNSDYTVPNSSEIYMKQKKKFGATFLSTVLKR